MSEIIEKIGLYVDLFVGLAGVVGSVSGRSLLRQRKQIRRALRMTHFGPNGVLGLIDDMSKSKKIDPDRYSRVLMQFNEAEWEIEHCLSQIEFKNFESDLRVSLKTAKQLDSIKYGKIKIRRELQSILNSRPMRSGTLTLAEKREMGVLSKKIRQLNSAIVRLEDKLG